VSVPVEVRRALAGQPVTLNGEAAHIVGVLLPFARVVTVDGTRSAEWSWHAVERICAEGGCFVA
jgi:hypothetical protein